MERFRKLYDSMLDSGELSEVFPLMSGDWNKDKNKFIREQTELEELLNTTNLDLDDIDDFN